jgi:hypothetical protein
LIVLGRLFLRADCCVVGLPGGPVGRQPRFAGLLDRQVSRQLRLAGLLGGQVGRQPRLVGLVGSPASQGWSAAPPRWVGRQPRLTGLVDGYMFGVQAGRLGGPSPGGFLDLPAELLGRRAARFMGRLWEAFGPSLGTPVPKCPTTTRSPAPHIFPKNPAPSYVFPPFLFLHLCHNLLL